MGRIANQDPEKHCAKCGVKLLRKRFSGRLEDFTRFVKRKYCSESCYQSGRVIANPTLAGLRARAKKFRGTSCEICGATSNISVHHVNGDPNVNTAGNIRTLCTSCHMKLHHSMWRDGRSPNRRYAKRLMGFEIDHTDSKLWETRSCRNKSSHFSRR